MLLKVYKLWVEKNASARNVLLVGMPRSGFAADCL